MQDEEIAAEIQERELEVEYLRELSASLGFSEDEGWSEQVFEAIADATPEQRRAAALRTVRLAREADDPSRTGPDASEATDG